MLPPTKKDKPAHTGLFFCDILFERIKFVKLSTEVHQIISDEFLQFWICRFITHRFKLTNGFFMLADNFITPFFIEFRILLFLA